MVSVCKETETWRKINNKMYLKTKLGFEPRVFVVLHSHSGSAAFSNPQDGSRANVPPYIQAENRGTAIPCLQWLQLHLQRKGWVLSSQYWALASGCQDSEDRVLWSPLDHDRFIRTPPSLVYFRFNVTALFPPLSGLPLCRVLMSVTHSPLWN